MSIKSIIRNYAHSNFDELVDAISDYKELVDAISDPKELIDAMSDSEELVHAVSDPKSDPSSDPKVATYTNNGNFPQKLLKNRFIPKIILGKIRPIDQLFTENVPGIR